MSLCPQILGEWGTNPVLLRDNKEPYAIDLLGPNLGRMENMEQWGANNKIVIETVKVTKEYLDNELAKYETWEEVCANESIITNLVENAKGWVKLRDQGVGQVTILKFLGGPWKQFQIQDALAAINDETQICGLTSKLHKGHPL